MFQQERQGLKRFVRQMDTLVVAVQSMPLEVESEPSKLQAGWLVPALDQFEKL